MDQRLKDLTRPTWQGLMAYTNYVLRRAERSPASYRKWMPEILRVVAEARRRHAVQVGADGAALFAAAATESASHQAGLTLEELHAELDQFRDQEEAD